MPQLYVSAAKREVTPLPEMLPMPSGTPFCGQYVNKIFDRGFTRALALKSGDRTALLIVTDIIEFANAKDIIAILSAETGIAKEDMPKVFERFYKTDKSRSVNKDSSGLGLYIVKSIIDLSGGRITVRSILEEYTEFEVALPTEFQER